MFARPKWRRLYNKYIQEHGGANEGCRALPLEVAVRYGFLLFEYARNTLVDKMKEHGVVLRDRPIDDDEIAAIEEHIDVSDAESKE